MLKQELIQNLKLKLLEMKNKKILVVLGGVSAERAVSLDTGKACVAALKRKGYSV